METDAFHDLIPEHERVLAVIGAPAEGEQGESLGWVHLALTRDRLWIAKVGRDPQDGTIRYGSRRAVSRGELELSRYPRSPTGPARIEIRGMDTPLCLLDMDQPDIFVQLRPFLSAWGRPIGGDGPIALLPDRLWKSHLQPGSPRIRPGILLGFGLGVVLGLGSIWWMA